MTIEAVDTAVVVRTSAERQRSPAHGVFDALKVGQELDLRVLRRLAEREYVVVVAGGRHVVESSVKLAIGAHVKATVTALGERLTLRYVGSPAPRRDDAPQAADFVAELAQHHGVLLTARDHAQLEAAAGKSSDPARMVMSGLYLGKLGLPLEARALDALYAAQVEAGGRRPENAREVVNGIRSLRAAQPARETEVGREPPLGHGAPVPPPAVVAVAAPEPPDVDGGDADTDSVRRLEELLADAFDDAAATRSELGATGGDPGADERGAERRARGMLNLQDGGNVGYRYATLPLLVGGELTELQVALFAPRRQDSRGRRVRRLVMTLDTPNLRQIRIEAKSVDERIAVAIDATTPAAVEALAAGEPAVRELLAQLSWSVEAVSYGVNLPPDRAARRIVDHVLSSGTVDETY